MSREPVQSILQQLSHGQAPVPRVLLVYAHPDDEAIAVGGQLPIFRQGLFVQVTDGAPRDNSDGQRLGLSQDEYRATRALESRAALAAGGLPEARHRCLNLPDKEAALHLVELTQCLAEIVAAERPAAIFTHPYEGGHADHDSCAFAVHQAVARLDGDRPLILESPFYFRAQDGGMQTGAFLDEEEESIATCTLSPEQQERKRAALACFTTQASVLQSFADALSQERFRVAPTYDFTRPACPGPAFYESFIPHMSAARFAQLASESLKAMQTESVFA